jgi:hypothetical protein
LRFAPGKPLGGDPFSATPLPLPPPPQAAKAKPNGDINKGVFLLKEVFVLNLCVRCIDVITVLHKYFPELDTLSGVPQTLIRRSDHLYISSTDKRINAYRY